MLFTIGREVVYDKILNDKDNVKKGIGGYAFSSIEDALQECNKLSTGSAQTYGLPEGIYCVYLMEGSVEDVIDSFHEDGTSYPSLKEARTIVGKLVL